MKFKWPLKGNNKGASLAAVLIAVIFVATIGTIITQITITNISIKEIQRTGQNNFYSSEELMDQVTAVLNDQAATCMQTAYVDILTQYKSTMVAGDDIQAKFRKLYMNELKNQFWNWDDTDIRISSLSVTPDPYSVDPSDYIFILGHYKPELLSNGNLALSAQVRTTETDAIFSADFTTGQFTLENVEISYDNGRGYNTTITTDIVFSTPTINFEGSNTIKEFMRYAFIADDALEISMSNTKINGNVYAGAGGIKTTLGGSANIDGKTVVTRGDILSYAGSTLEVGNAASKIWAENVGTNRIGSSADPAKITLNGSIYVADDLYLNAKQSTAKLTGSYFGYNFREKYDNAAENPDSSFSSAMMINGRGSRLDMSGLSYLLLAGRTFISRGDDSQNSDIMLGESVSARTNQLAYYVPVNYLDITDLPDGSKKIEFSSDEPGLSAYEARIGVSGLMSYLDNAKPVVAYHFQDNSESTTRYYLNFASEQKANSFFAAYQTANSTSLSSNAQIYADAIIINDSWLYSLKGDLMYTDGAGNLDVSKITITNSEWDSSGVYFSLAKRYATMYKSMQLYLEETHSGVTEANIRFYDSFGKIDKTQDSLLEKLIRVDDIKNNPTLKQTGTELKKQIEEKSLNLANTQYELRAVVNNANAGSAAYIIDTKYIKGIVIATGDVVVKGNFEGIIISGGKVTFANNGCVINANESYISELFLEDIQRLYTAGTDPLFATYFKDYNNYADSVIGVVEVDEYTSYANWVKNGD